MFKRILIFQHKGGEYISINISGFKNEAQKIWNTIHDAEKEMVKPSSSTNIALQVLDTTLSRIDTDNLVEWLMKMRGQISRLAIVGAGTWGKMKFKKAFRKKKATLNYRFLFDWEAAKDWLVGKRL